MSKSRLTIAIAFSCALFAGGRQARAQEVVATSPGSALVSSGLATFGVGYAAALVVAATSNHPGDNRLYVPVLGPWLDLGSRGGCPVMSSSCDHETTNKILLVGDGIVQAAGVITLFSGLLTPSTPVVATKSFTIAQVVPVSFGGGSPGVAALGRF
jgi:hypothetical protein